MQTESTSPEGRSALRALQTGAALVVLAALPYPLFQLDRYTFVKELVLLAAALAAALLCIGSARRITVFMVDVLVAGSWRFRCSPRCSPTNGWLATRASRRLARRGRTLLGREDARPRGPRPADFWPRSPPRSWSARLTGLIQAYGLVTTDLASLTRAPGGTFGNRNFMAHLVTIGLPVLLLVTLEARRRRDFVLGAAGVALAAAALVLSRSRAAWLGRGGVRALSGGGRTLGRTPLGRPAAPAPGARPCRARAGRTGARARPAQPAQLAVGFSLPRLA